ncbi:MAG: class I SAM-dependent methyltransferase [Ignavibacteria bacterium]|nr:class I SAM-dependent methyltransferase [Ignavibacteria bacterium]
MVQQDYNTWSATYDTDQNLTRDLDKEVLAQLFSGKKYGKILEFGCGTGKNTAMLRSHAEELIAIDFSEGMLERAKEKINDPAVQFLVGDITKAWAFAESSFNAVTCDLILEHIEDLKHVFFEAARCLQPGGRFYVCEYHPFRQYQGKKAVYFRGEEKNEITAFIHNTTDFTRAATQAGLLIDHIGEWWHEQDDTNGVPRLITFIFRKV